MYTSQTCLSIYIYVPTHVCMSMCVYMKSGRHDNDDLRFQLDLTTATYTNNRKRSLYEYYG